MSAGLGIIVAGAIGNWQNGKASRPMRAIGNIIAGITISENHQDDIAITDHPVERGALISDHAYKLPAEVTIRVSWSNSQPADGASFLGEGIAGSVVNKLTGAVQNQITGVAAKAIGGSALGNLAVANLGTAIANPLIALNVFTNNNAGAGTSRVRDIYDQLLTLQKSAVPFDVYTGKRKYESMLLRSITTETDLRTENSLTCLLVCRQVLIVNTSTVAIAGDGTVQTDPAATAAPVDGGTRQPIPTNVDEKSMVGEAVDLLFDTAYTQGVRSGSAVFQ